MADKVNVWRLRVVHGMEVVEAILRIEFIVVRELLLRDGLVALQAQHSIDISLLLRCFRERLVGRVSLDCTEAFSVRQRTIPF